MSDEKRACSATTKAGTPCQSPPLAGTELCMAHSPAKVRESRGFVADNGKAGRPRSPRAVDVLRERIEQDIDAVIAPLWEALAAEKSVVVGNGPSAHVESVPDLPTRIAAARELLDRGYGKPKQATELSGAVGLTLADLFSELDDQG